MGRWKSETYLALIAMNQDRVIRPIHKHAERKGDAAVRDCDEWALVGLDCDLEVLDVVFGDECFVAFWVRAGDECAVKVMSTVHLECKWRCDTYSIVFKPNVLRYGRFSAAGKALRYTPSITRPKFFGGTRAHGFVVMSCVPSHGKSARLGVVTVLEVSKATTHEVLAQKGSINVPGDIASSISSSSVVLTLIVSECELAGRMELGVRGVMEPKFVEAGVVAVAE